MGPAVEASAALPPTPLRASLISVAAPPSSSFKVRDDALGQSFSHDIRAAVHCLHHAAGGRQSGHRALLVLVTPDGERFMNTYLGFALDLCIRTTSRKRRSQPPRSPISKAICGIRRAEDALPQRRRPWRTRAGLRGRAHAVGFVLRRPLPRRGFLELMKSRTVDLVFAVGRAARALRDVGFDAALGQLRDDATLAAVTRSGRGCVLHRRPASCPCPRCRSASFVDATGAGDLFAAGFLFAFARGVDHQELRRARRSRRQRSGSAHRRTAADVASAGVSCGKRCPRPG